MNDRVCCILAAILLIPLAAAEEDATFDSDGVTIRYTVHGEGEPVILIHGSQASGGLNWRAPGIVDLLAEQYRVITIDARGHGKSDVPGPGEYGVNMVDDVVRLMDHLKIDTAHIAGYSMGGMITMKMLTLHPDRFRSATICGMGWMNVDDESARNISAEDNEHRFANSINQFGDFAITKAELEAIDVPMVVIVGDEDSLYERRVKPMAAVRPDVPVKLIPGATHISCVFDPNFKQAVRDAIDGHTAKQPLATED
jgi:pimeloyl-ACP methyl ester carboxylesterase